MMKNKLHVSKMAAVGIIVLICLMAVMMISMLFRIETIEYEGNTHYTDEEMTNFIFNGKYNVNALVYYLFGKKQDKVSIPFVQDYDVEVVWPSGLKVYVYEKDIIGYIAYMGCNMYFDRDGIIVDSAQEVLESVPEVSGIAYDNIVLHEKLDTNGEKVFSIMLDLRQLFEKYEIEIRKVSFDSGLNITVYTGDIKVMLGSPDMLTEKVHELNMMMPQLAGRTGTLYLNNFGEDSRSVIFKNEDQN